MVVNACSARVTVATWSVCVYVYPRITGYQAAYEQYPRLQCNTGLKSNVADFAKTPEFEREKLALWWSMLHSPTHQLVVHPYVYVVYVHEPAHPQCPCGLTASALTFSAVHPSPAPTGGPPSMQCSAALNARSIYRIC